MVKNSVATLKPLKALAYTWKYAAILASTSRFHKTYIRVSVCLDTAESSICRVTARRCFTMLNHFPILILLSITGDVLIMKNREQISQFSVK